MMEDDTHSTQPTPLLPAASPASTPPAATADDARAQRLARRSQLRDEAVRDAPEQERRRLEAFAAKAAAREARRASAFAAQSAEWRSFGPAQRLFTDGIASCLGFLALADFNSAAQTCKGWRVGAIKVKRLGPQTLDSPVDGSLTSVRRSPFRGLVTAIVDSKFEPPECQCADYCMSSQPTHTVARLQLLRWFSNLTSVDLPVDLTQLNSAAIHYPPLLSSVKFECGRSSGSEIHAFDATTILQGLAACAALTRLQLQITEVPVVLTALGALQQLRRLSIDGFVEQHYTPATLHAIKTMPQLETLELKHTDDHAVNENAYDLVLQWLTPLLTGPHQLQRLQTLNTDDMCLWDNHICLQLLPSLKGLTELESACTSVLVLPTLTAFKNLRRLDLAFEFATDVDLHQDNDDVVAAYDDDGFARLSLLVPRLVHCSLTDLDLCHVSCDGETLSALCNSQRLLQRLRFQYAALTTLQPLSTLTRLERLTVLLHAHSDQLPELFEHICACKSLQQLTLTKIAPALSEAQQRQLAPPSTVLPLLTDFSYTSRP